MVKFHSFMKKAGSHVTKTTVSAMNDAGFWKGIKKDTLLASYEQIRLDRKRNKGRPEDDIFSF